jgi:hypothetical protein
MGKSIFETYRGILNEDTKAFHTKAYEFHSKQAETHHKQHNEMVSQMTKHIKEEGIGGANIAEREHINHLSELHAAVQHHFNQSEHHNAQAEYHVGILNRMEMAKHDKKSGGVSAPEKANYTPDGYGPGYGHSL